MTNHPDTGKSYITGKVQDDLVSLSVIILNLGTDIRSVLLRNGLDKIESLLIHAAPTIQQMTRLGPKRMQRLEAALKDYALELRLGMYNN
jgi:hypothetical protein